jgi:putative ABC transport system substrate-binding protein
MAVNSADQFESAFKQAVKAQSGALIMTGGGLIAANHKLIVDLTTKNRLPAIFNSKAEVANGGLISYGHDEVEAFLRPAVMVDKILKAADLPVEQPTKFELAINLKTAKQIGVTIPANVLARADRVIK